MANKDIPIFKEGDHVEAWIKGLRHYGYVTETRQLKKAAREYRVDFYSYALGDVWILETELKLTLRQKNPKKLCVLIQNSNVGLLQDASDELYEQKRQLREECAMTEIAFLRGDIDETRNVVNKQGDYVVVVILEQLHYNNNALKEDLRAKGVAFIYNFQGVNSHDLVERFRECVLEYKEYTQAL